MLGKGVVSRLPIINNNVLYRYRPCIHSANVHVHVSIDDRVRYYNDVKHIQGAYGDPGLRPIEITIRTHAHECNKVTQTINALTCMTCMHYTSKTHAHQVSVKYKSSKIMLKRK